jgi:DNA-binding response OmpR family regulator
MMQDKIIKKRYNGAFTKKGMMAQSKAETILIVEDEQKTAATLRLYLRKEGFETVHAARGVDALSLFKKEHPIFVLLDLMIPQPDGIEVCRHIRQTSNVPIMMITARVEEVDKLVGLSIGADDYVTKPFSPREVVARVKAILRRVKTTKPTTSNPITWKGLTIDPERHQVTLHGAHVLLTHFEFKLLITLMTAPGRVYTREALLEQVYPTGDVYVMDRTIDVHIRNLREKIEKNRSRPRYLQTVRGVGYKFGEE